MIDFTLTRAVVLVLALAAAPVLGQVIYKSTMPDGRVIYGDAPEPGAVMVESTTVPRSRGVAPVTPKEQSGLEARQQERLNAIETAVAQAQKRVDAARAALRQAQ